jgi:hypothetical protein
MHAVRVEMVLNIRLRTAPLLLAWPSVAKQEWPLFYLTLESQAHTHYCGTEVSAFRRQALKKCSIYNSTGQKLKKILIKETRLLQAQKVRDHPIIISRLTASIRVVHSSSFTKTIRSCQHSHKWHPTLEKHTEKIWSWRIIIAIVRKYL